MNPHRPRSLRFTSSAAVVLLAAMLNNIPHRAAGQQANAGTTIADPDPARYAADIAAFKSADRQDPPANGAMLFVGSSSIRMWDTAEAFSDRAVLNRGFGGAHLSDVNHFAADIVVPYAPQAIVLYAGDNDIAAGKSPQQVRDDFIAFRTLVHDAHPSTHIWFVSIKPSTSRWQHWPMMRATNKLIRHNAGDDDRVHFVDVSKHMLAPDGTPRKELFVEDGLHLNALGYKLWGVLLKREFATRARSRTLNTDTPPARSDHN